MKVRHGSKQKRASSQKLNPGRLNPTETSSATALSFRLSKSPCTFRSSVLPPSPRVPFSRDATWGCVTSDNS